MIMRAILHRDPWTNLWQGPPNAPPGEPAVPWKPSDFTDPLEVNNYSQRLRDLIMSCLELVPENRPTFKQLRESILAEVGPDGTDPNLARLRDADPATDARFTAGGPPARADKYAIGLAIDDLPADALSAAQIRERYGRVTSIDTTWHRINESAEVRKGRMRGNGIYTDDTLMIEMNETYPSQIAGTDQQLGCESFGGLVSCLPDWSVKELLVSTLERVDH